MSQKNTVPIPDELIEARNEIIENFPDAQIKLKMDIEIVRISTHPRIKVVTNFDEVDDYQQLKDEVREIVRKHEREDQMFYTNIRPRESPTREK